MAPKVLQLNVTANWGSTGKIAEGIGLAAMAHGWESAIAYGRMMNPSKSKLIKVGNQQDVYFHFAKHRFLDSEGLGSKHATRNLIGQIETYAPDIIHLHNIHDHWLNFPTLFNFLASVSIPVVWTFHDCWAFTGGCPHFEHAGCYKWQNSACEGKCANSRGLLVNNSSRNFELKQTLLNRLSDRLTVIGVSEWISNYVKQSFLKNCKIETIYNGVDLETFSPAHVHKEKMILGVSNVWTNQKGLHDFFELRKLLPSDVGITLVGLSHKQVMSLPEGIVGIERTNNVFELANLYSKASIFVNPTYNDTFPTVNLEALACGTPVITYRTGGSPESVNDNTGIKIDKGDTKGLSNAINMVLETPNIFSSGACRARAEQCFDKIKQFGKYINLYNSLLKQHNR